MEVELAATLRYNLDGLFPFGDMKYRNAAQQNKKTCVVENSPQSAVLIW